MKVVISMAVTANGMIAAKDGGVDFVSKADWKVFLKAVRSAGNMVIGRRTFEAMDAEELRNYGDAKIVVLTHKPRKSGDPKVTFTNRKPGEVVAMLEREGFREALIAGGGILNSSFMRSGVVDEIYLYVEPAAIGSGIALFSGSAFNAHLSLVSARRAGVGAVLLHYKVARKRS